MRGGAQSHLIEGEDGRFYVVKFQNNPQHRRTLANEWIASRVLNYLEIATPPIDIVYFSDQFLMDNPEVHMQFGTKRVPVEAGRHFGSRFPGDPASVAVYDFVPDTLLLTVENLSEFLGILAFDIWTGNADARQSIFVRTRLRDLKRFSDEHSLRQGFVALMVDHGLIFNGRHWDYPAPTQGLYFRPVIYQGVRGLIDFEPWLDRLLHFPPSLFADVRQSIPPEWIHGDEDALDRLFDKLILRRKNVPNLLKRCSEDRPGLFPNWT